jgi:hypothetical protein
MRMPPSFTYHVSLRRVILLWGAIYGALWSLAPGILSELMRLSKPGQAATVILTGILTGVLTSSALAPLLARATRWHAVVLGVVSLPLGAWLFGFLISWIHWVVMRLTGVHYRFVMQIVESPGYDFAPLQVAKQYALFSTWSPFGFVLIPLAILTTLHLQRSILRCRQGEPQP